MAKENRRKRCGRKRCQCPIGVRLWWLYDVASGIVDSADAETFELLCVCAWRLGCKHVARMAAERALRASLESESPWCS